ncbi:hypothetical protein K488DRAFT_28149, partial [Vararia minispora EC-137]
LDELREQRAEAVLNAGRAWQGRNSKNYGGEIAVYYTEQARELGERVRRVALEDARARVKRSRTVGTAGTTIDLHFLTVQEAVAIAKETLEELRCTADSPLQIITGRGKHSRQGKAVLLPAVRTALVEDGWTVSSFDAGLVVRGR